MLILEGFISRDYECFSRPPFSPRSYKFLDLAAEMRWGVTEFSLLTVKPMGCLCLELCTQFHLQKNTYLNQKPLHLGCEQIVLNKKKTQFTMQTNAYY